MTRPLRIALLLLGLAAAGVLAYGLGVLLRPSPGPAGTALQDPPDVRSVALVDGSGAPMTLGDLQGHVVLVYFGYTRCPDVCPLTMSRLAKIYRDLGSPSELDVVMITVDPAHDTPEVVQRYVRNFDPSFRGLTGSNRQIAEAARTFYVGYSQGGTNHTDVVALLDREGRMRFIYGQDKVMALERDLPPLLRARSF